MARPSVQDERRAQIMAATRRVIVDRGVTMLRVADVAREAGVSAMAASAVLNGARTSSRIAPETRERILKAAAKLRYRPNAAARALANRRMHTLGVAAVIEGAVLISRLRMLPAEKVDSELAYLQIAIDKTASDEEREAWGWLREAIAAHRATGGTQGAAA